MKLHNKEMKLLKFGESGAAPLSLKTFSAVKRCKFGNIIVPLGRYCDVTNNLWLSPKEMIFRQVVIVPYVIREEIKGNASLNGLTGPSKS